MKTIHLLIADLFLPPELGVSTDLNLSSLRKILARSKKSSAFTSMPMSLENHLSRLFAVPCCPDAPIAAVSAAFDGMGEGCWVRADPVHLHLQRDRLMLSQPETDLSEAKILCAALNDYFAGQGMTFFAPHAARWYLRLDKLPELETTPLSQVVGRNVRGLLPRGKEATHWHKVLNEIQMLLYAQPVNEARETRGLMPINSLWLWGCGANAAPQKTYEQVSSDEDLAGMFAAAAGVPFAKLSSHWQSENHRQLLVFAGLSQALRNQDLEAWRAALQQFETGYAKPLWQALRSGKIACLQVDILCQGQSLQLTRADTWALWRRNQSLADYTIKE